MLEVRNLSVRYGAYTALHNVNLNVKPGEIVVLLGANGAGKSSLFRTLSGLQRPSGGDAVYEGKTITLGRPEHCVALGVAQCPEGRLLFPQLSVEKNLRLGAYTKRADAKGTEAMLKRVNDLFPILVEKRSDPAGSLSGGQQQMVAIGRALMARPKVLLLDEPTRGVDVGARSEIYKIITDLAATGVAVVMASSDMPEILGLANRALVMREGIVAGELSQDDLQGDDVQAQIFHLAAGLSSEPAVETTTQPEPTNPKDPS